MTGGTLKRLAATAMLAKKTDSITAQALRLEFTAVTAYEQGLPERLWARPHPGSGRPPPLWGNLAPGLNRQQWRRPGHVSRGACGRERRTTGVLEGEWVLGRSRRAWAGTGILEKQEGAAGLRCSVCPRESRFV
jgi:hypothetical protein